MTVSYTMVNCSSILELATQATKRPSKSVFQHWHDGGNLTTVHYTRYDGLHLLGIGLQTSIHLINSHVTVKVINRFTPH